jgi:malate dehydrogenase
LGPEGAPSGINLSLHGERARGPLTFKQDTESPVRKARTMSQLTKVAVIGAGNIGGSLAQRLAEMDLAREVVLIDIVDGLPQGKALDIQQSAPILGFSTRVTGSTSLDALAGADVVVETAGLARKPGMSRSDLLEKNAAIVKGHAEAVRAHAPKAVCVVVTNPVDVMTHYFRAKSELPPARVFGESGTLDTARFRWFVAEALKVAPRDVTGFVLGTHGDTMVPVLSLTSVAGVPLARLLPADRLQAIVERTKGGGGEIVSLLKSGSAYYAPTASQAEIVRAIAHDEHRLLSAAVHLDGEFGQRDVYIGAPVVVGRAGVERVVEVDLSPEERSAFEKSVAAVRADLAVLAKLPA